MSKIRTIMHYLTLGIVDSNEELARRKREETRRNTPFEYPFYLSESEFKRIAISVAIPIKRLRVSVENQFVYGIVKSSSGISTWKFTVDFNDFGTITGNYWLRNVENSDSQIPSTYAYRLSYAIVEHLNNSR